MKHCSKCNTNKPLSEFGKDITKLSGLTSNCRLCRATSESDRRKNVEYRSKIKTYKEHPKNKRATKDKALQRLFGISIVDYERMFQSQAGVCAICKKEETVNIRSLAVDHCHSTGKVRGLLCTNCNQGIGHFKDNVMLLNNAIGYLAKEIK